MTTSSPDLRRQRSRGFTLVEVLIAASLGTVVLAGVLSSFLMLVRSGVRVQNYAMMEAQTRRAFEQMGIDTRMANSFVSHYTGNVITSFTLTVPDEDLNGQRTITYGYAAATSTRPPTFFVVPGSDPAETSGRIDLVSNVTSLTFLRYDTNSALIPATTTADTGVKHIQVSISVSRSTVGVVAATQVIRSSAFTLRNISI